MGWALLNNLAAFLTFQVFYVRQKKSLGSSSDCDDDEADSDDLACSGCGSDREWCQCESILSSFHSASAALVQLGCLECLAAGALSRIVHSRVDRHVLDTCTGSFTVHHLPGLEEWLEAVVVGWMRLVYAEVGGGGAHMGRSVEGLGRRLRNHLYETYAKARIDQVLQIKRSKLRLIVLY